MATDGSAWAFLVSLATGLREGNAASVILAVILVVLLVRLVLPGLLPLVRRLAILSILVAGTWLGYQQALELGLGTTAGWAVLGLGAVVTAVALVIMVSNARAFHLGPQAQWEDQPVSGARAGASAEPVERRAGVLESTLARADAEKAAPGTDSLWTRLRTAAPSRAPSLSVTLFLMVAVEFAVVSSSTLPAPDPGVGLVVFLFFQAAALAYVLATWRSPKQGAIHYGVVAVSSVAAALILYYTWAQAPLAAGELLPWAFFSEPTLLASVTGVGFSLAVSGQG